LKKVKYYKQLLAEKEIKEMVGITKVNLDGNCKCSETNLANIITDSYIRIVSILNKFRTITYIYKVNKIMSFSEILPIDE